MKSLYDYIKNNPGRFDTDEPLPGHFDRFSERLESEDRRKMRQSWYLVSKVAAAVILGLVIAYTSVREFGLTSKVPGYIASSAEIPELKEAEQYYHAQLELYYSKIQNMGFGNDKAQKKQILDELSDMDRQVLMLKRDLKQNPEDERVLHAIINYYQVKLELMDMIITRTQESNNAIL